MTAAVHWYSDNASLARALAESVAGDLRAALRDQAVATLAVSGGRSPVPVFEALRSMELEWERVVVTLVDERWVPESDPASNGALVRTHLLQGRAAAARFVPMYNGMPVAADAEAELSQAFAALSTPFAALILGMGDDGHTASLFPNSPQLEAGLALGGTVDNTPACLAQVGSVAPTERMSLTLPWILHARRIYLQLGGESKLSVFEEASLGAERKYPVSFVLAQTQTPVEVFAARP